MSQPIATYFERFPGVRRDFVLYSDKITVSGKKTFSSMEFDLVIALAHLSVNYHRIRTELRLFFWASWAFLLAIIGLGAVLYFEVRLVTLPIFLGGLAALSLGAAVWGSGKLTFFQFIDQRNGTVAFDVCYFRRNGKAECEEFVDHLILAIGRLQQGEPPADERVRS